MPTMSKICLALLIVFSGLAACSSSPAAHVNPAPDPRVLPPVGEQAPDISELYRQIGLIAAHNPVAFVGKISAFASKTPDTTLVLVSMSLPNRALTFSREGDRYRAPYEVNLVLNRGDAEAGSVNAARIRIAAAVSASAIEATARRCPDEAILGTMTIRWGR